MTTLNTLRPDSQLAFAKTFGAAIVLHRGTRIKNDRRHTKIKLIIFMRLTGAAREDRTLDLSLTKGVLYH
jgi:hypothetical protein